MNRSRQLDQLDIESMLLEDAGVLGNEESQKGKTKSRVADFDLLKFLRVRRKSGMKG